MVCFSLTPYPNPPSAEPADYYKAPWIRFLPYLHGILMGFILWRLKGKEFKMHQVIVTLGWILAAAVGLLVVFGLKDIRKTSAPEAPSYTMLEAVLYEGFAKTGWSLSLAWVAFACSKGYGGLVDKFLSWGLFQPFAKMSYMAYLFHLGIIFYWGLTRTHSMPMGYWPQVKFFANPWDYSSRISHLAIAVHLLWHQRDQLRSRVWGDARLRDSLHVAHEARRRE